MKKQTYIIAFIISIFIGSAFGQEGTVTPALGKGTEAPVSEKGEVPPHGAELKEVKEITVEGDLDEGVLEWGVPQVVPRKLSRFGDNLFKMPVSTFCPISDVPVGPDYILGTEDELIIDVWGMIEGHYQVVLDRDGGISLPKIGRLHLWGLTFEQAERLIRQKFNKYFTGFELSMTMGRLRTIKVFVVGEIKNPGTYELSSLSTLFHAFYLAGGCTSTGTMRKIQLIRNNKIIGTTDIYEFLLTGKKEQDYKLQSGDTIFVPLVGPLVGISGKVKRPAIYELKDEKNLLDLINLAGGMKVTAYGGRLQVERIEKYEKKVVLDLENVAELFKGGDENNNIPLQDGDFVKVFPIDSRIYNKVFLDGFVKYPGEYELKCGMKLSDLLTAEQLLPEAYLERGEIESIDLPSLKLKITPFSPKKLLEGDQSQNLTLQQLDKVKIFSEWKEPESIEIKGEIKLPGKYTIQKGERLSAVLKRAGGFTKEAFLKGAIFTRISVKRTQQENIDRFTKTQEEILLREMALIGTLPEEKTTAKAELLRQQKELISLIASRTSIGRVAIRLCEIEKLEGSPYDLILENGDSLFISKPPMVINVVGAVNNPGAILWSSNKTIDYYMEKCGGLTKNADRKNIFTIKADGIAFKTPLSRFTTKTEEEKPQSLFDYGSMYIDKRFSNTKVIEQGDTIIVTEEIKMRSWEVTKDIFTMIYQLGLSAAVILK